MLDILRKQQQSREFTCVYTNTDDASAFTFGVISAVNEEWTAIEPLTSDGEYDGIFVIRTNNIFRVDTGGQYVDKMNKLCKIHNTVLTPANIDEANIIESTLEKAIFEKLAVAIETEDSGCYDIRGIPEELSDGVCKILVIDEYGNEDGFAYVKTESITEISCDCEGERRFALLWETGNGEK